MKPTKRLCEFRRKGKERLERIECANSKISQYAITQSPWAQKSHVMRDK